MLACTPTDRFSSRTPARSRNGTNRATGSRRCGSPGAVPGRNWPLRPYCPYRRSAPREPLRRRAAAHPLGEGVVVGHGAVRRDRRVRPAVPQDEFAAVGPERGQVGVGGVVDAGLLGGRTEGAGVEFGVV